MFYLRFFITSILLSYTILLHSIDVPSIFDQISYDEVVNVEIKVDMEALTSNVRNETKHAALFSYKDDNGVLRHWDIKMKLRGKFRRMKCTQTPPMKLYFDKDDLANAGLSAYNDLKLINYCEDDKELAREFLVKEYLSYKIYNQLTPESFKVQLLRITFKDVVTNKKIKQWGFVIEDTAQLVARLDAPRYKGTQRSNKAMYDLEQVQIMGLFQYMIGNTDWRIGDEKNIKVFQKEGELLAIPYDFDFSGLVNPSYGLANSDYNLTTLTERVYLGYPSEAKHLGQTIELFKQHKKAIYTIIQKCKHLSLEGKISMQLYLDSFYDELNLKTIVRSIPLDKKESKAVTPL